jgi:hypothetical protein
MPIAPLCISHHSASGAWLIKGYPQNKVFLKPLDPLKDLSASTPPLFQFLSEFSCVSIHTQDSSSRPSSSTVFYLNGSGTAPSLSSCSRSVTHLIIAFRTPKVVSKFTYSGRASQTHSIHQQGRLDTIHHPRSRHYNSGSSLLQQDGPSLVSHKGSTERSDPHD